MRIRLSGIFFSCLGVLVMNCGKNTDADQTTFTRADSLTDLYLYLQDSMLQSWNIMINDDNQKIKAMHDLLHELMITAPQNSYQLNVYEEQLDHLSQLRYNRTSMADEDLIEEYDFASNLLVSELISLAESKTEFAYSAALQRLVENIRIADQRVNNYRAEYDAITTKYNAFLESNKYYLKEFSLTDSLEMKPLFQMTYED